MKSGFGGGWPTSKGIYGSEGIRGPLKKKTDKSKGERGGGAALPSPPVFRTSDHAIRFLIAWLSHEKEIELDAPLCRELLSRVYPLHKSKQLWPRLRQELPLLDVGSQKRLLANLLEGRWLDLLVPPKKVSEFGPQNT